MTINIEDHDGIKLLQMAGELTGDENTTLVDLVTDLLTNRNARIALDLSQVQYMNSAGLSDLVRVVAQANIQEARVVLANPSAYIAGVLEMTKLDSFFEVHPTTADAIKMLGEKTPPPAN
ncbi:MAG: STAS domain-containing protein [Planctomycetota bacterium]